MLRDMRLHRCRSWALCLALGARLVFEVAPAVAATRRAALPGGMVASLSEDQEIFLEATPAKSEGLIAFSRRLTGTGAHAQTISRLNGEPRRLLLGVRYKVPYEVLAGPTKVRLIQALFPSDSGAAHGWIHQVPEDGADHSLWRLAEWFTGRGQNFSALREYNRLPDNTLPAGQGIVIPAELLLPDFLGTLPLPVAPTGSDFGYERTDEGEFLVYRLKRGEALYSSVVMRFNGSIFAEDVNALAREIAKLNGIRDVTDIPVGWAVRVPFDLLLPEFLPPHDPRRLEYERNRSESEQYTNTVRTSTLAGITVILDAGHGGQDPGALPGGVWESTYVYDIMLRIKTVLEARTAAEVAPTTRDGRSFQLVDLDKLPRSRAHEVLTDPPYPIVDTTAGTHLRWYLANSIHRAATRRSGDPQKTVFISIHADSLHSSVRGAMAYIPAAGLTDGEYGKSGSVYTSRKEVREQPRVDFSRSERVKSEGLSRQLASHLLSSFKKHGLPVKAEKPIRDRVVRCRRCRPWVPAVVRRNAVPAKLLLEVCNLNNDEDRRLLQTRAFRQRVAEAVVDGILAYYGQSAGVDRVAASSP